MAFIESGKSFDKEENHRKMKKKMESMDSSTYLLKLPASLHKKVKMKLVQENKKLKPVLIEMLEEYIKE